jgi:hypothetical protein
LSGADLGSQVVQSVMAISSVLDGVAQDTNPFDFHFEDIGRPHENRGPACSSNATGCSGDDYITRLWAHRDADHCDQRGDAEYKLVGARILHHSAVQAALNAQPDCSAKGIFYSTRPKSPESLRHARSYVIVCYAPSAMRHECEHARRREDAANLYQYGIDLDSLNEELYRSTLVRPPSGAALRIWLVGKSEVSFLS